MWSFTSNRFLAKALWGLENPFKGTAKLAFLNKRVLEGNSPLCHKLFGLEYYVVSPLYYRLQKHLIDWGTRNYHPQLPQYPDKEALLR